MKLFIYLTNKNIRYNILDGQQRQAQQAAGSAVARTNADPDFD